MISLQKFDPILLSLIRQKKLPEPPNWYDNDNFEKRDIFQPKPAPISGGSKKKKIHLNLIIQCLTIVWLCCAIYFYLEQTIKAIHFQWIEEKFQIFLNALNNKWYSVEFITGVLKK